mgnify:FL=1
MKINHKESFRDFGKQFTSHSKIDGYHGSLKMLIDITKPFELKKIKNKKVMEVGSGSGRIIKNLLKYSPAIILGIEPSKAIKIAKKNIRSKIVEFKSIKGEDMNFKNEYDYIFSLGVIHHIPNHQMVTKKIYNSLKKKGQFICWVYGHEGNQLYILFFDNLRRVTRLLPDFVLRIFSVCLNLITYIYGYLCNHINLPLKKYFIEVFNKCDFNKRNYIIFDQLNPSYSKYFKKEELNDLLKKSGFKKIAIYHRHNYSWIAIAEK